MINLIEELKKSVQNQSLLQNIWKKNQKKPDKWKKIERIKTPMKIKQKRLEIEMIIDEY